jgi:hypothetical protein
MAEVESFVAGQKARDTANDHWMAKLWPVILAGVGIGGLRPRQCRYVPVRSRRLLKSRININQRARPDPVFKVKVVCGG